ncbi:hypothetical protein BD413DRAFT_664876 [Trametes elegans]|nr:hypothetical protein BD413DRAFT_664876 [Trametes elegans]
MSEDMPPSWRSLASAASRSIKGYLAQQRELKQAYPSWRGGAPPGPHSADTTPKKQSWGQWAGQKLRRGSQSEYDVSGDRVLLFPGWATRRYREPRKNREEDAPFDVDVFVSGYAYKLTGIGFNTRAGRTFLRLAKSFAALPKLPVVPGSGTYTPQLSRSTEELLSHKQLPPLPDEITEESEIQALDDRLRQFEFDTQSIDSGRSGPESLSATSSTDSHSSRVPSTSSTPASGHRTHGRHSEHHMQPPPPAFLTPSGSSLDPDLQRWHANLEARLHPFWSSTLSNRTVRITLYAADPTLYDGSAEQSQESVSSESSVSPEKQPIMTREAITGVDGSFQVKFSVPWEHMCVHPAALQIAFGGADLEQDLFVTADLLAPPSPSPSAPDTPQGPSQYVPPFRPQVAASTSIAVPLSYSSVRVISDIDDTVKLSGILGGARAVFHNVFVKDLQDSVIRGMGDWYMNMWRRGVRFHYVSNGPFELLPVVNEFLQISRLPPGSIRLRSYGGRSLFNGLLSAPAMRKRAGVLDVLNHFPDARFLLVGDSGEQDLELYAEIARERPDQILGIFIRDASPPAQARPLDDPTGAEALAHGFDVGLPASAPSASASGGGVRAAGRRFATRYGASRSMSDALPDGTATAPVAGGFGRPGRTYSGTELPTPTAGTADGYFDSAPRTHGPITEEPGASPEMGVERERERGGTPSSFPLRGSRGRSRRRWARARATEGAPQGMSDAEKKRWELQMRLWKARLEVAPQIPIRVFREPEQCVEVEEVLDRLQVRGR